MRSETMPQRVGRRALIQAGFLQVLFEHPGDAPRRQPRAEFVREYGGFPASLFPWRERAFFETPRPRAGRVRANRCEALFLPFSTDANDSGREIDVAVVES